MSTKKCDFCGKDLTDVPVYFNTWVVGKRLSLSLTHTDTCADCLPQLYVFKFEPDQPQVISLKYRTGKPFRRGDYSGFTYTLANGLVTLFPPEVDREIQALHIDAGQPIRITKKKSGSWDIERVPSGPGALTDCRSRVKEAEPPSTAVASNGCITDKHCSNGSTPGALPALTTRESQPLYRQLVAAIEAVKAAEEHGNRIGYPVKFQPEDIRAMAISGFIQQAREGY